MVVEIKGNFNGLVVVIRCDIDVLFILEEINFLYKLKIDGKMYVCGYDFYIVVILGVVYLVKKY